MTEMILDNEGELTDVVKRELEESRKVLISKCIPHEEVERMLLNI